MQLVRWRQCLESTKLEADGSAAVVGSNVVRNGTELETNQYTVGEQAKSKTSENYNRAVAQSGSAFDWGSKGRWFESSRPDYKSRKPLGLAAFLLPPQSETRADVTR